MGLEVDIARLVFECIEACLKRWGGQIDELKRLRARARSLPAEVFAKGLAYTLVLIASRSSREAIEVGLNANKCEDVVDKIRSAGYRGEKIGYALYGAILAYVLKSSGFTKATTFKDFVNQAFNDHMLLARTPIALEWIKRLAEAYIHE